MSCVAGFRYLAGAAKRFAKRRPFVSVAVGLWLFLLAGNVVNEFFDFGPHSVAKENVVRPPQQPQSPPQTPPSVVSNSAWDGSVWQVERYLKAHLKDPDSFDAIEWSEVLDTGDGFTVRCKYRARNSFGGMVIENKLFRLSTDGTVVSHVAF